VRAPMVSGEPLSTTKFIHADAAGFMAAMVDQGMRAVSIGISTESGAGGFILPNDRVDVLCTVQISDQPRRVAAITILRDVRVLAVDQTYREDKDEKVVLAKTATLELTPHQAEKVEQAQATGTISLALRALGDNGAQNPNNKISDDDQTGSSVTVIGYGVARTSGVQGE
jgi:pilus assembly protein CpaB